MKGIQYCILLLLSIICWAACIPTTDEWDKFKRKFNKQYGSETEELDRMKIFHKNLKYIAEQNLCFVNGEISYSSGINMYCDLTNEELKSRLNGFRMIPEVIRANSSELPFLTDEPDSVDWRKKGAVTPIKNQGLCSSCWAFSATGTLEGYHFIKTGKLVSLSEQQLVDCDIDDLGCFGGNPYTALMYVSKNKGINNESSYPYIRERRDCQFNSKEEVVTCNGVRALPMFNETALKHAVATIGPVSVAISVSDSFRNYRSGKKALIADAICLARRRCKDSRLKYKGCCSYN
ncbi:digestive cysteine proteinase 1-like isoform X2 [Lycorma delicatula]|uniref:digestive cysteine proteinase 1-like isoform X2 n=1 Tax=Lycorma delicatula TaxID=130591 RepID=UPI003F50D72A